MASQTPTLPAPTVKPSKSKKKKKKGAKESVWPSNIHAHKEEETSNAEKILSQRGSFRPLPNVHLATAQYLPPPKDQRWSARFARGLRVSVSKQIQDKDKEIVTKKNCALTELKSANKKLVKKEEAMNASDVVVV
ncbi:hypothetical protein F2Q69_00005467 [Brassica cretica]|uniref:Uncharacterized protein n=1 Tax=Brassica cretica TaxID=69181 RepID=A0A8S9P9M7_BRACR|nr:hypothetical protein F2Q69_00005467 [Brassica cretica]